MAEVSAIGTDVRGVATKLKPDVGRYGRQVLASLTLIEALSSLLHAPSRASSSPSALCRLIL